MLCDCDDQKLLSPVSASKIANRSITDQAVNMPPITLTHPLTHPDQSLTATSMNDHIERQKKQRYLRLVLACTVLIDFIAFCLLLAFLLSSFLS